MNKIIPAVKKIVLWTVLPFLSLNVLIGLACGVLFVFDRLDLYKLLGGAELYVMYVLLVVSLMCLSEVYLKVRSGNVSEKNKKKIVPAAVFISVIGLMMEYPAFYGEDWAFLFGPACMFIVFLSCMVISPLWSRRRRKEMKTVLKLMSVHAVMCVADVVIFHIVMTA